MEIYILWYIPTALTHNTPHTNTHTIHTGEHTHNNHHQKPMILLK